MLMEYVKKKRKEKMHTQRRYATCLQRHVKKNIDSSPLKITTKGERVRQKEFIHGSPKIFHTLAHLDQVV